MRTLQWLIVLLIVAALTPAACAQEFRAPINALLQGDDPGQVFTFMLDFDPATPNELSFVGYVDNFVMFADQTHGVAFNLTGKGPEGIPSDGLRTDFLDLPLADPINGPTRTFFDIRDTISFTPETFTFVVEGGGPGEHFRVVGEVAVIAIPEPGMALTVAAALMCVRIRT